MQLDIVFVRLVEAEENIYILLRSKKKKAIKQNESQGGSGAGGGGSRVDFSRN
jgi:hypothetical protein